jgi:predicted nucleotidyltransferase
VRQCLTMSGTGLDPDGFIAREGDLARVPPAFAPVVEAAKAAILCAFSPHHLHSAYLYGSIPRGTAVPGTSDLDVLLALHDEPSDADRAVASSLEDALDGRFPEINGAGIELASTSTLLSDIERYDLGWFVACLCTPLIGEDLAASLPRYQPTSLLARETNGDVGDLIPRWRDQLAGAGTDSSLRRLSRLVSRRVVRTGFTLVMPRWGGWTSDLRESAAVFGLYYPARADQMRVAAAVARTPTTDRPVLAMLINDLGPWLAAEYVRVHGRKTPRG